MRPKSVTRALLGRMPLPALDSDGDKEARGRVLVVGGSEEVPGAVLLAGIGALRAGAGKLQLATVERAAIPLGLAVPEALVVGLPATRRGEISGAAAAAKLRAHAAQVDALLIGPGLSDDRSTHALIAALVRVLKGDATLVLDAAGALALRRDEGLLMPLEGRAILTPHAGEMATMLGIDKREVESNPADVAQHAAERFGAVVALKGAESWIAEPGGALYRFSGGSVGLATSGSGDTLSGVVSGLAARGASPVVATVWGVWAHGAAGRALSRRMATVGFLARELLAEIPALVGR